MGLTTVNSTNQGLIGTYGQYYNRGGSSFNYIFGFSTYPQRSSSNMILRYVTTGYCMYLNSI